ncbi:MULTISPECIES: alpha/beta hydrolase [Nostocales]|uniref:Phospholipase n=3 Tax=Nostocales TaxID=1161 RepID=A0A0C1R4U9_9CYAN|nr:alpha/beta hydrolase-fold protein [Tolypothrix bouteillei]KAF3886843.1 phospholipase [Tolypothrix bouteillei VB521301]
MTQDKLKQPVQTATQGKLRSRPTQPVGTPLLGLQPLELDTERDGLLYIPKNYQASQPAPLILMLHGAGGNGRSGLTPFLNFADASGVVLLAPDSRLKTWDVLYGHYGLDIAFIDQALAQTFSHYAIDPTCIAVEGFSDGASYALGIGITNGDLFSHVIAFSPGFVPPVLIQNSPRIFISHGKWDNVLQIDRCSRRIVPALNKAGYKVTYQEFDGFHTVPATIARSGLTWFMPESV